MNQLLSLGETEGGEWLDYRSLGLSDAHVPVLIEMLLDERIAWAAWTKGEDETPYWTHVHVWRALGQLGDEAAIEPLLRRLALERESDFANEDIPEALGMIGPAALGPVRDALPGAAGDAEPWNAVALSEALKQIATRHPHTRDEAVAAMTGQLQGWQNQGFYINTFLISNLIDLRGTEAAGAMEAAIAAQRVDTTVTGDWEDVQVALGLLAERITPLPVPEEPEFDPWLDDFDVAPAPRVL
ncbi:MAG TPA: hypothetical protein VLK84_02245, partial [Longimicrobium sp.]|nr:hypothetical protein [Longimicrobium sp.]